MLELTTRDTIVAISTPPGRGGIGIVRLSGVAAIAAAQRLVPWPQPVEHARARFARVLDERGDVLDEAVVTVFQAPRSYTGEDLVEIAAHGSPVVLDFLVQQALALSREDAPVRLAEPGEFSRRAFLAGRLDLTQAEAIHDLIAAQTLAQARMAAQQMGGALSRRVAPMKTRLLHLIAMLEAGMDFATGELDDVDTMPPGRIAAAIAEVRAPLEGLAASFRVGSLQRNGAKLALVGAPNAGKSSLFNRLLERDRAIVTAMPGTTRDTLEETFALDGIPVRLMDTAGLRGPEAFGVAAGIDEAEALGIARSREALADADVVLLVEAVEISGKAQPGVLDAGFEELLRVGEPGRPVLRVLNKIDLAPGAAGAPEAIRTSARTGEGMDDLRTAILLQLRSGAAGGEEAGLNNLRQQQAVVAALGALAAGAEANDAGLPHELLLLDLHAALTALDTLTGQTTNDDILGLIFSTFCIGK